MTVVSSHEPAVMTMPLLVSDVTDCPISLPLTWYKRRYTINNDKNSIINESLINFFSCIGMAAALTNKM